jgi:hypothetical protein
VRIEGGWIELAQDHASGVVETFGSPTAVLVSLYVDDDARGCNATSGLKLMQSFTRRTTV